MQFGSQKKRKEAIYINEDIKNISSLVESSEKLDSLLNDAFKKAIPSDEISSDVKIIKELTSALKEAVNIKRNLLSFPDCNDDDGTENEKDDDRITVFLDDKVNEFSN